MRGLSGLAGRLMPKSVQVLREGYGRRQLRGDVLAGATVGVIALPLAMAFAIGSGVGPERGLYTAIVAGALISLLGGSRFQIGGPTGAFVVVVAGVMQLHGYEGLAVATLMAGGMLVVLSLSGLAGIIRYIPYPVTTGFTSGIAVIIFSSQVKDFLGLRMAEVPAEFLAKWQAYGAALGTFNPSALAVGAGCLAVLAALRRWAPRVPGALVVVAASAALTAWLHLPAETIGTRFGGIPNMLPRPSLPAMDLATLQKLLPSAFTIAVLAAIESLLSAVVADGMTGDHHRPDAEVLAQGLANIGSVLFGGIPATGAIARTAANIRSGAASPFSGVVHAATLLAIMLLAAPWAGAIPLASLSAVLILVAWNMSEWENFRGLFRAPRSDVAVLLATFALTVLVDLNVAIGVGVVLASLLFMRRMIDLGGVSRLGYLGDEEMGPDVLARRLDLADVEIYEIAGPFFFGVADRLKGVLNQVERPPRVFILRMRHVPAIDATGLHALRMFWQRCHRRGTVLVLSGVRDQPRRALRRSGLADRIGADNLCGDIEAALARAGQLLRPAPVAAAATD